MKKFIILTMILMSSIYLTCNNEKDSCPTCPDNENEAVEFPEDSIFVTITGNDTNDGSAQNPKKTIQAGIDEAVLKSYTNVFVSAGIYQESISLAEEVKIYGGYDPDFSVHDTQVYLSIIIGITPDTAKPGAVNAVSITGFSAGSTIIDGFIINGYDATAAGQSSYAVYIKDCDQSLQITNNIINAGNAGDGSRGADGTDGAEGVNGTDGSDAIDLYNTYTILDSGCTSAHWSAGGQGGALACLDPDSTASYTTTDGGDGGNRVCPYYNGSSCSGPVASEDGKDGSNNGGTGGLAGWDVYHQAFTCTGYLSYGDLTGEDGQSGNNGTDGSGGQACSDQDGIVVGGIWYSCSGINGTHGTHGSGGGGGGSGAGASTHSSCNAVGYNYGNIGPTGGGGGSGGGAGSRGYSGSGGGGSFCLFIIYSAVPATVPSIENNIFTSGKGGDGGDGGNCGIGGTGGKGAFGGTGIKDFDPVNILYPSFDAGNGGDGGQGGNGGGGAGGIGGVSYGIFIYNYGSLDIASWKTENDFAAGLAGHGGYGGFSPANSGQNGLDGINADTNF